MNNTEIIKVLNEDVPECLQDSWDNSGLQVEGTVKEVKRIYIAMDLTDKVIDDAIEKNVDMIITHHPLIFSPIKRVTTGDFIQKRLIKLIKNDIVYYAMHTNFDKVYMGELAAKQLGIQFNENLEDTDKFDSKCFGYGKVGTLPESMTVLQLCEWVKEKFEIPNVKVFGDESSVVSKVAIMPGSGKSFVNEAVEKNVDVMITGDIDHHTGIDALARNLIIIDGGHYGIEHIFVKFVEKYINEKFTDIEVLTEDIVVPFEII